MSKISSSILIIGNEILSGRTQDINVQFIAKELSKLGINLSEVRIVPDNKQEIVFSLNQLRKKYDYVFTTGGIGPTHDDITSECVCEAFNLDYSINSEAYDLLKNFYPQHLRPTSRPSSNFRKTSEVNQDFLKFNFLNFGIS